MAKKGGSKTVTTDIDPASQKARDEVYGLAREAGNVTMPGVNGLTQEAIGNYRGMTDTGNLGMRALGGDAGAISTLMNPYQQNVMDAMNRQFGDTRLQTMNAVDDAATQAGAFGGSRHGVAEGVALSQLGKTQNDAISNLLYSGFGDAMNRAGTAANLGFGANGQLASLGDYSRNVIMSQNPALNKFNFMNQAVSSMPHGQTQTTPMERNAGAGALGGASIGAKFGPWGALGGAVLGGLFG